MWASLYGHVNVVEKLLAAGADPNHQNKVRNLATRVMLLHVANCINVMLSMKDLYSHIVHTNVSTYYICTCWLA